MRCAASSSKGATLSVAALGVAACARRGLRRFHLLARFGELRRQKCNAAAFDARLCAPSRSRPPPRRGVLRAGRFRPWPAGARGLPRGRRGPLRRRGCCACACRYSSSALSPAGSVSRLAASAAAARGAAAGIRPAFGRVARTPARMRRAGVVVRVPVHGPGGERRSTPKAPSAPPISTPRFDRELRCIGGAAAARLRCSSYFLTAASANNLARPGDMGLWMNR